MNCVECEAETPNLSLVCDACAADYADDWQDISTAPRDGTSFQARIPGHGADNVIAWHGGFLNSEGEECGVWAFTSEQEPPECWTDGVCWTVNEDEVASVKPTHWKPLPALLPPLVDDTCPCPGCRSDMAGIVPCREGDE